MLEFRKSKNYLNFLRIYYSYLNSYKENYAQRIYVLYYYYYYFQSLYTVICSLHYSCDICVKIGLIQCCSEKNQLFVTCNTFMAFNSVTHAVQAFSFN